MQNRTTTDSYDWLRLLTKCCWFSRNSLTIWLAESAELNVLFVDNNNNRDFANQLTIQTNSHVSLFIESFGTIEVNICFLFVPRKIRFARCCKIGLVQIFVGFTIYFGPTQESTSKLPHLPVKLGILTPILKVGCADSFFLFKKRSVNAIQTNVIRIYPTTSWHPWRICSENLRQTLWSCQWVSKERSFTPHETPAGQIYEAFDHCQLGHESSYLTPVFEVFDWTADPSQKFSISNLNKQLELSAFKTQTIDLNLQPLTHLTLAKFTA